MKQLYNTALYMRLSRDDENFGDSVSIETQRTILRQYAKDNNLNVVDEYIDDGWSGTNFERPAFIRMMNDVEAGKINCIVTKDLSRFGREHVMMDYYLEFVFPEKQIRYIAVTENEDTEKGLSDFVPFKNLFNEWFAKDTSRKVKAALQAKFAAGEKICTYAPIGYKKDPNNRNKLIIDEETRWIIEKIFDLAVHGAGSAKITRALIDEKVPTPGWFNYTRYGTFANIYANQPIEKSYQWTTCQIKSILKDETYIGNTIHNKQTNISYKNKKKIRKPQEEWFKVENTHEAIISKEVFEQVQEQIASRKRKMKDATTQMFSGLIKCSDCGKAMSFANNTQNKTPKKYYVCSSYRQYGLKGKLCTSHYLRYDVLYAYVLMQIRYWAESAQQNEEKLLETLVQSGANEKALLLKKQADELNKFKKRKAEVDRLFAKMYEDWANERITEYNFNMMSQKFQMEQQELDERIENLETELATEKETVDNAKKWIALIKQFSIPTELTAELLNTLVEKIVVHEATKNDMCLNQRKIDIYFRFVGKID